MMWAIYLFCLATVLMCVLLALPRDVWATIHSNCRDGSGRIKTAYLVREIQAVSRFLAQLLLFAAVMTAVVLALMLAVNRFVPLTLVVDGLEQVDVDPKQWRRNLTSSPGNVKAEYERFHIVNGGRKESARESMHLLWDLFPIAATIAFVVTVIGFRSLSTNFQRSLDHFAREEASRELRRIRRRYLAGTQPEDEIIV